MQGIDMGKSELTTLTAVVLTGCAFICFIGCQTIDPVPSPTTTTTTTTIPPAPALACHCDLTQPVVQPPYTAKELKDAGQSQECPVYQGMDIRFYVTRTDAKTDWTIAVPFKDCIHKNGDGTVTVSCNPSFRGVQWHVRGYHQATAERAKMTAGNTFKYIGPTMCVFAECLEAK